MGVLVTLLFLLNASLWLAAMPTHAEPLYVCDDGKILLFTNKAERGCPVYEPQSKLVTVPDGSTWADVQWAAATQHPEAFQPRPERRGTSKVARDLCHNLWPDLKLRPRGTVDAQTEADLAKWQRLSSSGSLISDPCERYMAQGLYPRTK